MIDGARSGLQIAVLAAGFSSRLGRPKVLEKIHGTSLIRRTVEVLARVTSQTITVVTAQRATRVRVQLQGCRVRFLANPARVNGLSTSVSLALRHTRYGRATLLLPADLAALDPRDIARLIRRWQGTNRKVVARGVAGRASTPLILPKSLYPQAQAISGDVGLRDLVAALPPEQRLLIELPSASFDVDTGENLAEARRRAPRYLPRTRSMLR